MRALRGTLFATSSALTLIVAADQAAVAQCFYNNQAGGVDNTTAQNCISYNSVSPGSPFSGNVVNDTTGTLTPTGVYTGGHGTNLPGTASGISVLGSGTTLTGNIINNGTIDTSLQTGGQGAINIGGGESDPGPTSGAGASVVGSITNNGTITGPATGINVVASSVTDAITNNHIITDSNVGIYVANTASVGGINNAGTITSTLAPIAISDATVNGNVVNSSTGKLIATGATVGLGVINGGTINGSIENFGSISESGISGDAIQVLPSTAGQAQTITGSIVNETGGQLTGGVGISVLAFVNPATSATVDQNVVNNGTIGTTSSPVALTGIQVISATVVGAVTNGGTITAGEYGIQLANLAQLTNVITSSKTTFSAGPAVVKGGVTNSGTITSTGIGYAGILLNGANVSMGITNTSTGTITASGGVGILVSNVGRVTFTNGTAFTNVGGASTVAGGITNAGSITAKTGIMVTGGSTVDSITNSGTLTGSGGTAIDVTGEGAATIINQTAGTITGNILLSTLGDTVNVTGGAISGNIVGQGTNSTLNFALGSGSFTYANSFTTIKQVNFNSGTVTLEGADTVTKVAINGGTVVVGNNSAFGTAVVTMAAGTTLSFLSSGNFSVANNFVISGDPFFTPPVGTTQTISGVISDGGTPGVVDMTGAGTLVLTGANTYSGGTVISAGALRVTNASSVGTGKITLDGGAFQSGAAGLTFTNALVINTTGGTIDTQANTLTLSGPIGNGNGTTGALAKIGAGTLILTGTSSYTGATNVNAGALQAGAANVFAQTSAFSVASGATLNLNSFNQTIGSLAGAGGVTLGAATLTTGGNNTSTTFSGVIGGSGVVTKTGSGVFTLTGANTYMGGTTLSDGTLVVGNNSALGTGALAMAAGTTLSFLSSNFTVANPITISGDPNFAPPAGTVQTLTGVIADGSSPGTLAMTGAGTLVLAAANTYTGPTVIDSGTLDVTGSIASSSLTTVASGATLTGTGTLGNLQVGSGSTFTPGTAGSPGTATTVAGNLTFQSGATYRVYFNPATSTSATVSGTASLAGSVAASFASGSYISKVYTILSANSVSGTFGSLTTSNLPSNFNASLSYDAAHAYLDLALNFIPPTAPVYTPLNANQSNVATALINYFNTTGDIPTAFGTLTSAGLTAVDGEVATGAERGALQLSDQFLQLMLDPFVDGRSGAGWPMSGGIGTARSFAPEQEAAFPADIAMAYAGVLKAPPKPPSFDQRWSAWGAGFGGSSTANGDPAIGSNGVTATDYGYAGGLDYHFSADSVAGFALAGGGTDWNVANGLGSGRSDAFQVGLYGTLRSGPSYVAAAVAFANHAMSTSRFALGDDLTASFNAQVYSGRLEAGYRYAALPTFGITPYAALQVENFHTPAYSETDVTGGGFGLAYNAMSSTDTRSELGARFDDLTMLGSGLPLELRGRVAWAHDWVSNPALFAVFETLPGAAFIVNGAPLPKDSALTTFGGVLYFTPALSFSAKFDGEFAGGSQTYAGTGTLRYTW